ncbi:MAG: polysaccharide biosynthesis protein [Deltaproteobacteria bacterium]|uniref:oligosaccharide flippase family protein n=1 Tax=Hydrosulfovibrio ferrireducens TaxID=2934181 RepID=UPI0012244009|nr:MAG: polysaccharide biosynthesis protein [Deltaproteobacteria bacterium]
MAEEKKIFQKIKEAGSHSMIYGLGSVLQTLTGFVLIPLYTRYYTTDIYGVLALVTISGTLAGSIFYLGASSALARSYYDYDDPEERKRVVSTSLYITLFGAILQVILGFSLGGFLSEWLFKSYAYRLHIALMLTSSAFTFINTLFYMLLRFQRLSKYVIILNIVSLLLSSLLIVFFLVWAKLGVLAPILGGLLSQTIVCGVLFLLVRKNFVMGYSDKELKIQILFGLQSVIIALAYYSFDWLNRFFINKYCSLSEVGIYSLGYQIGMSINILLIFPFCQIWAPMRMQYRNDHNADEFYKKILTYYFMIGLTITASISVFAREIITLLAGHKEYVDAFRVVPFVMLGMLIYGAVNIIDSGIYFSRKVIYHAYIFWFTSLVSLILNYLLVPRFGYLAAAFVILVCYCTVAMLVFMISNRLYAIPYEGKRLAALMGLSIAVIVAGSMVSLPSLVSVIVLKLCLMTFMCIVIYTLILYREEKDKIHMVFRRVCFGTN